MRKSLPVSKPQFVWILFLLLLIPGLLGLFHQGFFVSDDGNWMVIRFSAFYDALRHGQFPVRFLPRLLNGYGYPVADFLYPLFMYLGVPIHIVGIHFVNTIKIIFGLSFIFSGVFTFLWLRKLFHEHEAFIGALAYVYFPYHLYDLYKRGSIGEMLALAIVPYLLWQIERKQVVFVGVGIGFLILAHNTLALLLLPLALLYYFLRQKNLMQLLISVVIGLGMSAFFWIPALVDKQYTVFDNKTVSASSEFFVNSNSWYLLGLVSVLGLVVLVLGIVKRQMLPLFWGVVFMVSLFFALPVSQFIWHILPLTKYVQFPFRFLSITTLSIGFAASYVVSTISHKKYIVAIISLVIFMSAVPTLFPKAYQLFPDTWYSTNQDSTTVQNEYLPLWVATVPTNKSAIAQIVKGKGSILQQVQQGSNISLQTDIANSSILQINTIYYPGWEITVDDKHTSIVDSNTYGLIQVSLPVGKHTVKARFTETPLRFIADIISLIALVSVGILALLQYKNK